MIKIEHTRKHKLTFLLSEGHDTFETLVTDAKLVLVEYMTAALPNCIIDTKNVCIDGKCYKPILISLTEKIEVGDWVYESTNPSIFQWQEWCKELKGINKFKILALPEHFSPQQLQMIVDGKLKDGDKVLVLVEAWSSKATDFSEVDRSVGFIKLNPHITIYPVEENVIDKLKSIKPDYDKTESYQHGFHDAVEVMIKWFEQNVK